MEDTSVLKRKALIKEYVLPIVHEILHRRYGELTFVSGQGIARGERVQFWKDGQLVSCVIKTSNAGRISFGRRDGKWSGLGSDFVVIVAPRALGQEDYFVSMFDQRTMKIVFQANQDAQEKAGMDLPNWIAPFHEEGRGARGVGDGFGDKALWIEPLNSGSLPVASETEPVAALTIAQAKHGLAKTFGVSPEAIEIIIKA
jgi:hypothetical protein